MPKQLTAQTATITTAAVEVKTLTVSGKQVTLAVFRQLTEEPILDSLDAHITGSPWGRVNYHPDKCGDDPQHMHVVWQKGDELRRATIQAPDAGYHSHPAADLYVQARIIHRTAQAVCEEPRRGDPLQLCERTRPGTWRIYSHGRLRHDGMNFRGEIPDTFQALWRREGETNFEERAAFDRSAYALGIEIASSREQVAAQALEMLPTTQFRQSWAQLSELPQLFIAV